jgi:hypothetical protein
MNCPSEQKKPQDAGEDELKHSHPQSSLQQLSKTGHEEAAQSGYNVSRGSLARHDDSYQWVRGVTGTPR